MKSTWSTNLIFSESTFCFGILLHWRILKQPTQNTGPSKAACHIHAFGSFLILAACIGWMDK
uniref:Uncharacterized protein n=1 Tax=Anguilla anguilla TaxID=7936 RepID=A0A0E9RMN8_ANGAN